MLFYCLLHWLHWLPECVASHAVFMLFREMHWVSLLGVPGDAVRSVTHFGETSSIYEHSYTFEAKVWERKSQEIHGGGIVERYLFVSSYAPSMLHHFVNLLKVSKGLIDAQGFNGLMMGWCNLHFPSCSFTAARSADLCVPWAMSSRLGKDLINWAICSRRPSPLGSKFSKWWFII